MNTLRTSCLAAARSSSRKPTFLSPAARLCTQVQCTPCVSSATTSLSRVAPLTTNTTPFLHQRRWISGKETNYSASDLSTSEYHSRANETMDALIESLEQIVEENGTPEWDIEYESGVLTLNLGPNGTYVINKQPPNKQIWLSSPLSGPKRYDYDSARGVWFYSRDGGTLRRLLETEISGMLGVPVDLARRRDEHNS